MKNHLLKLRQWCLNDAKALKWLTNRADYRYMDDFLPQGLEDVQAERVIMDLVDMVYYDGDVHQAVVWDDRVVGSVGVSRREDNYNIDGVLRCMLLPEVCGRGIGTEVVKQVVDDAMGTGRFQRLTARVFDPNSRAIKILERNGFVYEGTRRRSVRRNGMVYDELIYGRVWK
jgi:ribosomal-protein-alanine N-acetyltransferase